MSLAFQRKRSAKRSWFMLVNCFIKRQFNLLRVLIMICKILWKGGVHKQRGREGKFA